MFTALKANRGKQEGKKKMSHTLTCAGKHVPLTVWGEFANGLTPT